MRSMTLSNPVDQTEVVAFRIGEQDYCIDIGIVREIRGWTPTTVLPHAPPHVTGVINLRGAVVAVVDLAARLGLGRTAPTGRNVVIIVSPGDRTVGLLADVVSDILGVTQDMLQAVPDVASDAARRFITNVITLDEGRMLRKLDLDAILATDGADAA
jgi:purine-binding chemotaxis protein CheW